MWPILGAALLAVGTAFAEARKFGTGGARVRGSLEVLFVWGALAAVLGVLGTLVGMSLAARAIERAGHVAPALLWGGFKAALSTSIVGFVVFAISLVAWFLLRGLRTRRAGEEVAAAP